MEGEESTAFEDTGRWEGAETVATAQIDFSTDNLFEVDDALP